MPYRIIVAPCAVAVLSAIPVVAASGHGSLAIFVPTQEGLVVCADKREWNSISGANDSHTKIYAVGSRVAFVATGAVSVLDRRTLRPSFSVYEAVLKHLTADPKQPSEHKVNNLSNALDVAYHHFRRNGGRALNRTPGAIDGVIFSVTVWHVNGSSVKVMRVQLHEGEVSGVGYVSSHDMSADLTNKFSIEGQTDFVLAAIRKSDPRFKSFKEDPDIRAVWTSTTATGISRNLAVLFARKIIRATNEFHAMASPSTPTLVSADSDCSLMSPARGFEWITK